MPTADEKLSKRFSPFHAGDVVCTRGVFSDGTKNGDTVVMVLHETTTPRVYAVKVLDVRNKKYRTHLQERDGREQIPHFRFCKSSEELVELRLGEQAIEPVTSWFIVAEAGDDIDFSLLPWMSLEAHRKKFSDNVSFMMEYMKSDNPARDKAGDMSPTVNPPLLIFLFVFSSLCLVSLC